MKCVARLSRSLPLVLAGTLLLAGAAGARTLKIATIVPDGSSWMQEMRATAKLIEERTEGRVKLKFYPGGIMGNDNTVLRKMRVGQLQGGAFPSGAMAQSYPDAELYSLPLFFRDYGEVDYVRSRLDDRIKQGLLEQGYVVLSISDGGFAHIMSQQPIRRVEDLANSKAWVLEGDKMSQTAFDVAGVAPVPLPLADVYTGLQTGLIDTVAGPPIGAIAFQWHTKVKYFTDVPLMYLIGIFAIDKETFDKLTPGDQAILRNGVEATAEKLDAENRKSEANAIEALVSQGVESVSAESPAEVERWRRITRDAEALLRKQGKYSEDMIQEMHRLVDEYRASQAGDG